MTTTLGPETGGHFQANFDDIVLEEAIDAPTCNADSMTLCLQSSRFQVTATFDIGSGSANAHAVPIGNSGYFWFFDAGNVEAVVKVVNGCGVNDKFWFFAGGLTNVHTVITVRDTHTSVSKTYVNPASTAFQPVQDTSAFDCP